jgi:hypothetical protein
MLLAQYGQSRVRMADFPINDLPSFSAEVNPILVFGDALRALFS